MCRKYVNYKIEVTYLNGDKEVINNKEMDKSSYKEMLELYRETKEHYESENMCVKIDFIGVSEDRELNILWTKEIINREEFNVVERAKEVKQSDVLNIIKNIKDNLDILKEKSKFLAENLGTQDKKRDLLNHKIENCDSDNPEVKLEIFNELQLVLNERRKVKNDLKYIKILKSNIKSENIRMETIYNIIDEFIDRTEYMENKTYDFSDENIEDKLCKTYKYKNFKEKINMMKQLEQSKKYDKITIDESKMEIYAYTKCKKQK